MAHNMSAMNKLLEIMRELRDPQTGCPWDIEQTHQSIKKYVIEEAYEVAEAIDDGDAQELKNELGDLLLQVVFHAQMSSENGGFEFDDVAREIGDKIIARHPHVFGDAGARTSDEQREDWEKIKAGERAQKGETSALDGVAKSLPALTRAYKLQKRAARVGFDWYDISKVREKVNEEFDEIEEASDDTRLGEFGDLLFAVVNFGRHLGLDPEEALAMTNKKFTTRFAHIETHLDKPIEDASLDEMEALWQDAKHSTKDE